MIQEGINDNNFVSFRIKMSCIVWTWSKYYTIIYLKHNYPGQPLRFKWTVTNEGTASLSKHPQRGLWNCYLLAISSSQSKVSREIELGILYSRSSTPYLGHGSINIFTYCLEGRLLKLCSIAFNFWTEDAIQLSPHFSGCTTSIFCPAITREIWLQSSGVRF